MEEGVSEIGIFPDDDGVLLVVQGEWEKIELVLNRQDVQWLVLTLAKTMQEVKTIHQQSEQGATLLRFLDQEP